MQWQNWQMHLPAKEEPVRACEIETHLHRSLAVAIQPGKQSWFNWYSIGPENRHSERISGFESLALRYAYVVKR